jgi:hypothetical protein
MVWVMGVVRVSLDQLEQVKHKSVVHVHQIFDPQMFNPGHLVHQFQQKPVQSTVLVSALLHKVQQPREASSFNHLAKGSLIGSTVEEQEVGDHMELAEIVLLQQAVDDLGTDIVLVVAKDAAVDELLRAACEVVFVVEEAVPAARNEVKPASQGVVDQFVGVASQVDDFAEL